MDPPLDLTIVNRALDKLVRQRPYLPRPAGLEQVVLTAWTGAACASLDSPRGRAEAVIRATWPIGARSGAQRGHIVTAAAIRDTISMRTLPATRSVAGQGATPSILAHVAARLPALPDNAGRIDRPSGPLRWVGIRDDLDVALAIGLGNGWLAGHRYATDRLIERFVSQVTRITGESPSAWSGREGETSDDLVAETCAAAYEAADDDQTTYSSPVDPL